jgi:aminoglycoside phosphotransferase family enzyme
VPDPAVTIRRPHADSPSTPEAGAEPGLAEKVAFLQRPRSYPMPVEHVESVETHMSWLFLTERDVYKLKKPYRHERIDYGSAAARRRNCLRELRLNRRLAPDFYLGMSRLTVDARGRLHLDGPGRTVDWLVHMRRLPEALSLERRLQAGRVGAEDIGPVVAALMTLFRTAPAARWSARGYVRHLTANLAFTSAELHRPEFGQDADAVEIVRARLRRFIETRATLFADRVRDRRIVEGHGDLRPEHVYLTEPPMIVDCIEFDRDLRLRDPVDELAFLAMECDRMGYPEVDAWLFTAYVERSGDAPPRALVEFHKAFNAFNRAKIAVWHLDDPATGPPQQWIARAADYLARARSYTERMPPVP